MRLDYETRRDLADAPDDDYRLGRLKRLMERAAEKNKKDDEPFFTGKDLVNILITFKFDHCRLFALVEVARRGLLPKLGAEHAWEIISSLESSAKMSNAFWTIIGAHPELTLASLEANIHAWTEGYSVRCGGELERFSVEERRAENFKKLVRICLFAISSSPAIHSSDLRRADAEAVRDRLKAYIPKKEELPPALRKRPASDEVPPESSQQPPQPKVPRVTFAQPVTQSRANIVVDDDDRHSLLGALLSDADATITNDELIAILAAYTTDIERNTALSMIIASECEGPSYTLDMMARLGRSYTTNRGLTEMQCMTTKADLKQRAKNLPRVMNTPGACATQPVVSRPLEIARRPAYTQLPPCPATGFSFTAHVSPYTVDMVAMTQHAIGDILNASRAHYAQQQPQQQRPIAARRNPGFPGNAELQEGLTETDVMPCSICLTHVPDWLVWPCKHSFCGDCLVSCQDKPCAICRKAMTGAEKIYAR